MNMSMCFIVFILAFGVSYVANSMLDVGDKINGLTPRTTGTQRVAAEVAYPPYSIYFTIVGWIMPALYCLWFYFFGSSSMPQESNDDEASSPPDKRKYSLLSHSACSTFGRTRCRRYVNNWTRLRVLSAR